jgi:hypothetical protein
MKRTTQEALIYLVVAISALFFMSYSVHMLVGGLVAETTEYALIALVCLAGIVAIVMMARDVIRHRRRQD